MMLREGGGGGGQGGLVTGVQGTRRPRGCMVSERVPGGLQGFKQLA